MRLFLRSAALVLTLTACTTPSGGTPTATARLDTLTPAAGAPGTAVEITGRIPANATLHLCGVALVDLLFGDPETTAATHFTRATGTTPTLTPGSSCTLTIVRDGQTLPNSGATLTFTTDASEPEAPGAPVNLSATVGNESLAITFSVPIDGGSPITRLEFTINDGADWNLAATSTSRLLLAGFTNEQPVTVRLRVANAAGTSPSSEPITATPTLWPFARRAGGAIDDNALGVSALADGSAIVTGYFTETATFGATTLTSEGSGDVFVAKTNPDGSWAWATRAGGGEDDQGTGVSALADGSALVTGHFRDTATFGATTLTSAGSRDVFVAKLDPDGGWSWATSAGGAGSDLGYGVDTLADGSAVITGYFVGDATFGATTLTSAGGDDVFVARIDPDGSWVWAARAGGAGSDRAFGVGTLSDGGAIVTGFVRGTADFGTSTLTTAGGDDVFVAKISPGGTWAWAASAGGAGTERGLGVGALADGSAIVTGYFEGTALFGGSTLVSAGAHGVFVAKTNSDGLWAWATSAGGPDDDAGYGVSTLTDGSAIVTGNFNGSATFGATTLTSAGGDDVFAAKTDPDGSWAWATSAGGSSSDVAFGVSTLADGGAIITGIFAGTATFGATTLTSAGNDDAFVAKVSANGAW